MANRNNKILLKLLCTSTFRAKATRRISSSTRIERKLSDLDFADDIAQLENDPKRAHEESNNYSENSKEVVINAEKTVEMVFRNRKQPTSHS
ncbi:unnamed protein product [Brachionus calyciflorus]|uniref:Uncharacterized protein n=1 Tax=Brachionus calyciflorus TaxID=104777 RepID=A0A814MZX5_9BILA|nr:unnamed protein product [Brachionus calyciflorus]